MSWNHNSGFHVHGKQKINGANGDRIEKIARYMSRAAISVQVSEKPVQLKIVKKDSRRGSIVFKSSHDIAPSIGNPLFH